ncbi:MAG: hypothetical protein J6V01_04135, partial [Clostridia bacterium]|nr:hypothetical protein [Clostridia bacterium]
MKIVTENRRRVLAFSDKPGFLFSDSMGPYVVIYDGEEPQGALQENYIFTGRHLIVRVFPKNGSEFAATTGVVSPSSIAISDPRFV